MANSFKKTYFLTLGAVVCAVILRIIQINFVVDAKTGFFLSEFYGFGIAMSVTIFVFVIAAAVFSGVTIRQIPSTVKLIPKGFAICNFIMALAVVYESFFAQVGGSIPAWQVLLQIVFGFLSAAVFVINGLSAFTEIKINPMANLAHVLFWLVRLIIVFSSYLSVSVISENIFEMAALCLALVYFLNLAKMQNDVSFAKNAGKLMPVSTATFMLCAVYSLPQIILMLTGREELLHTQNVTYVTDLCLLIYVLCHTLVAFKNDNLTEKPAKH